MKDLINQRIKRIRKENNLSQKDLANSLNVSTPYIAAIEQGKQMPNTQLIMSLKEKFNISSDWLLFGEEREEKSNSNLAVNFLTDALNSQTFLDLFFDSEIVFKVLELQQKGYNTQRYDGWKTRNKQLEKTKTKILNEITCKLQTRLEKGNDFSMNLDEIINYKTAITKLHKDVISFCDYAIANKMPEIIEDIILFGEDVNNSIK